MTAKDHGKIQRIAEYNRQVGIIDWLMNNPLWTIIEQDDGDITNVVAEATVRGKTYNLAFQMAKDQKGTADWNKLLWALNMSMAQLLAIPADEREGTAH